MKERLICRSENYDVKKLLIITLAVVLVGFIVLAGCTYWDLMKPLVEKFDNHKARMVNDPVWEYLHSSGACDVEIYDEKVNDYVCGRTICSNGFEYAWAWRKEAFWVELRPLVIATPLCMVLCVFVYLWLKSYEIVISDKRIYGKVGFGKRVDLPNDSISAIATIPLLKGITVSTSSGRISFLLIKNANEIYNVMNSILIERQQNGSSPKPSLPVAQSVAEELKTYKELMDSGVITQEEFDAKRNQLLGL